MSRSVLNYEDAHDFVASQSKIGNDVRWEGWDMVFFKPTPYGYSNPKGAFRRGRWGMESRITANNEGQYIVPAKSIKVAR